MNKCFLLKSPKVIRGISPARAQQLAKEGINNIGMMFRLGPARAYHACEGMSKPQVGNWFCAASLLQLRGLTPQQADLLLKAGVRSVRRLASLSLEELASAVKKAERRHKVDLYALSKLQQAAAQSIERGLFIGRVLTKKGNALPKVRIDLGEFETMTDLHGWFAFDQLPAGTYRPRAYLDGRIDPIRFTSISIVGGRLYGPVVIKYPKLKSSSEITNEETSELDGNRIVNTRSTTTRLDEKPLTEFRDGTLFEVRKLAGVKASLLSLYLVRRGLTILVQRTQIPQKNLPPGSEVGKVLSWSGGKLELTDRTRKQINEEKGAAAKGRRSRRLVTRVRVQLGKEAIHLG